MTSKKKRIIHSTEFKAEFLKLAEKVGVAAEELQLGLHESRLYGWVRKLRKTQVQPSGKKPKSPSSKGNWSIGVQTQRWHGV